MVALLITVLWVSAAHANVQSQAFYARGLLAYSKGQWDAAYALFDKAVQADSTDPWSLYYRGLAQGKKGATAGAIADIQQALEIDPGLPHAALDLGVANLEAGRIREAQHWLQIAYQQGNERHVAALFLGIVEYRLGNNAEAAEYLQEAQADPEVRASARYYHALALIRQRRGDAAREELDKVTREDPEGEQARAARPYLAEEVEAAPRSAATAAGKPWSVFGKLGFEYDSNVVAGPSDEPPQPGGVRGDVSRDSDGRAVLAAGGQYRLFENEVWSVVLGGQAHSSIHFSLSEFDLLGFPLWLEIASHWGPLRYGIIGEWHYYMLDYENFYQEGLGTPWLSFEEAENLWGQIYYTIRGRDFFEKPFDPGRDGINHAVGLRQQALFEPVGVLLNGGVQYDKEDTMSDGPMGSDFKYDGFQFDVGARYSLNESLHFDGSYLFRLEDYEEPNSLAGAPSASHRFRRHDNTHFFLIGSEYDLNDNIAFTADFLAVINGSNIPNFEYDRFIISPGVRVRF